MKLIKMDDQELQYLKILVYGITGIGKTTSLKTLGPLGKNALIVIPERGAGPLRGTALEGLRFSTWEQVRTLIRLFMSSGKLPAKEEDPDVEDSVRKAVVDCKLLVIDSLSSLHDMLIEHIVTVDRKDLLNARGKTAKEAARKMHDGIMTLDDWGAYKTRLLNFIRVLSHLDVHIICTALGLFVEDKKGLLDTKWAPALSGKSALECLQHFGQVFSMESMTDTGGVEKRVWRTKTDGRIQAKDESGLLDEFEETNWLNVIRKIMAKPNGGAK